MLNVVYMNPKLRNQFTYLWALHVFPNKNSVLIESSEPEKAFFYGFSYSYNYNNPGQKNFLANI